MPTPAFADAGAGQAGVGTSITVAYPASVTAGDMLVVHVYTYRTTSITTPSGYTSITSGSADGLHHCYYKVADGTEGGGSLTVAVGYSSGSYGLYARIYRFTGAAGVEGTGFDSGFSSTIADRTVTTTAAGRLACNLVALSANLTIGNFTGMTGGTWAEALAEFSSTVGSNATLQLQTAVIAAAGTINGGTTTCAAPLAPGTKNFGVCGFALTPAPILVGIATETDTPFPVTATKGALGLRVVAGQATETDTPFAVTASKGGPDLDLAVGVDFGNGFEDLGSSVLTGSRVISATVTRGRPFNLDVIEAATADLTFQNADGWLDPSNFDSPWYGHILPISPVRILRRQNSVTYPLLTGVVENWTPNWQGPNYQDVQVTATDDFETLTTETIVSGISTTTTAFGSNKDLMFTAVDAGENGDQITISYVNPGAANASLGTAVNEPLSGGAIAKTVWPVHQGVGFPGSFAPMNPVGLGSAAIALAVDISGSDITVNLATNGSTVVTSTASDVLAAMQANPDIVALITVALAPGSTGAGVVPAMAQINLAGGKWPSELTGTRINRVLDLVGWDATLRAIDDGVYLVAEKGFALADNTSALSHIQEVADAELGYFFIAGDGTATFHDYKHRRTSSRSTTVQVVFSDDGTGFDYVSITPVLDKDRIVNQATITGAGDKAQAQVASDPYSQTGVGSPPAGATNIPPRGFGKRDLSRSTQLLNDSDALAQAEAIVAAFSYPLPRFDEITTYEPRILNDAGVQIVEAWVESVLALEIGDLIEIRTTPPANNTTTSYTAFVEQITDTVQPGRPWARTLKLSPVSQAIGGGTGGGGGGSPGAMLNTLGTNLVLDDATLGVIG